MSNTQNKHHDLLIADGVDNAVVAHADSQQIGLFDQLAGSGWARVIGERVDCGAEASQHLPVKLSQLFDGGSVILNRVAPARIRHRTSSRYTSSAGTA